MLNLSFRKPAGSACRILCLGAHSDDIEIGCGGTLLYLLTQYDNVVARWVVFSASDECAGEARRSAGVFPGSPARRMS